MFKYNKGSGAVTCDECDIIIRQNIGPQTYRETYGIPHADPVFCDEHTTNHPLYDKRSKDLPISAAEYIDQLREDTKEIDNTIVRILDDRKNCKLLLLKFINILQWRGPDNSKYSDCLKTCCNMTTPALTIRDASNDAVDRLIALQYEILEYLDEKQNPLVNKA